MKLHSLITEARKAQKTTPAVGISRDLDIVAERLAKGKRVRATMWNGTVVNGKVAFITNAGFRGIEVHVLVGKGAEQVRRIVKLETVRIWL